MAEQKLSGGAQALKGAQVASQAVGNIAGIVSGARGVYEATRTSAQRGRADMAYMDAAYPGTSPWERVGGGAGYASAGAAGAGVRQRQTGQVQQLAVQEKMQQRELQTRLRQSAMQGMAQVLTQASSDQPAFVGEAMRLLQGMARGDESLHMMRMVDDPARPSRQVRETQDLARRTADSQAQRARLSAQTTVEELRQKIEEEYRRFQMGRGAGHLSREAVGLQSMGAELDVPDWALQALGVVIPAAGAARFVGPFLRRGPSVANIRKVAREVVESELGKALTPSEQRDRRRR